MTLFKKHILLFLMVCSLPVLSASAQESHVRKVVYAKEIYFQFDKAAVNPDFSSNAKTFEDLDHFIRLNGEASIDSVVIVVQSSPDGVYEHNISLTKRRACSISRYMKMHYPSIADKTAVYARGEAWDRLRENILSDKTLSDIQVNDIIKILDADINVGTRKWRMERLETYPYLLERHYPRLRLSAIALVYAEEKIQAVGDKTEGKITGKDTTSILQDFSKDLTYVEENADIASSIESIVRKTDDKDATANVARGKDALSSQEQFTAERIAASDSTAASGEINLKEIVPPLPVIGYDQVGDFKLTDNVAAEEYELINEALILVDDYELFEKIELDDSLAAPVIPGYRYPVVAFKTNLLMPGFNAGIEVPIGNHWSVAADWYWPWFWPKKTNEKCYELLGGAVEGRYWFGRDRKKTDRLLGHSIGLYVHSGYFDLEKNYRGLQGEFVSTGLDYKYALGLGGKKHKRWGHLEFSIGLGYLYSTGRTYDVPKPGGALIPDDNVRNVHFFGPTRAEISLVIPVHSRKEGRK